MRNINVKRWLSAFAAILICSAAVLQCSMMEAEAAELELKGKFLSGSYFYGNMGTDIDSLNLDDLDYIIYAFVKPHSDGNFRALENPDELRELVEKAHAKNVKVFIGLGGGSAVGDFESLMKLPGGLIKFTKSTMNMIEEYNLDGVDLDWESPVKGYSSLDCETLVKTLHAELKAKDLYFTAAMAGVYSPTSGNAHTNGWTDATLEYFDWLHLMTYSSERQNSQLWFPDYTLNYWHEIRGIPEEKLIVGLPLFAMPSWKTYEAIIAENPENFYIDYLPAESDEVEESNYNGVNMVKEKIKMSYERGGGVFTWVLNWDSNQEGYNMTGAISQIIKEVEATGVETYINKVSVFYNKREIMYTESSGYPYVDKNGRTMVPARQSGELLGMTLGFEVGEPDEETGVRPQKAIAKGNNITIEIPIGESYIVVNGQQKPIDTQAVIIDGRTYLPLRAFFEAAGCKIEDWHESTKTAYVTK